MERDKRFDLVIHEKFKVANAVAGRRYHLFKTVGPKTLMVAAQQHVARRRLPPRATSMDAAKTVGRVGQVRTVRARGARLKPKA